MTAVAVAHLTGVLTETAPSAVGADAGEVTCKHHQTRKMMLIWLCVILCVARVLTTQWPVAVDRVDAAAELMDAQPARAVQLAREALSLDPLDGRAYRVLAQGPSSNTAPIDPRLLSLALRYAPRDVEARLLAAQAAEHGGDVVAAMHHYDRLMRVAPVTADGLYPNLRALLRVPGGVGALAGLFSGADPVPWREGFLRYESATAASTTELNDLYVAVAQTSVLSRTERALWVSRLVDQGAFEEAARAARTGETGPQTPEWVHDGAFAHLATPPLPFEWMTTTTTGVEITPAASRDPAGVGARVLFTGSRVPVPLLRQLVRLPTGQPLRVLWQEALEGLDTPRGVRWVLRCAHGDSQDLLHSSPHRGTSDWQTLTFDFSVPDGCRAQWLQLEFDARIPAETEAVGIYHVRQMEIRYAR